MKKVAILFSGIIENYCFKECFSQVQKNLINNNPNYEFDIFMYLWSYNKNSTLPKDNNGALTKKDLKLIKIILKIEMII